MGYESQKPHTKQMHVLLLMNSAISNAAAQRNNIILFKRFFLVLVTKYSSILKNNCDFLLNMLLSQ